MLYCDCNFTGWKWLHNICVLCGKAFIHGFDGRIKKEGQKTFRLHTGLDQG